MKRTAVVYDKWLRSLGGGEVVACSIAKILVDEGYDVTFIAGKNVDKEVIRKKLNIDLSGVNLVEVWSDEAKIKKLSKGKDLFINTSFIDYTYGCAKRNIYYTHFPKEPYSTFTEMLFTRLMFPLLVKFINSVEMMNDLEITTIMNNEPAYLLQDTNRVAISYLEENKSQVIEFSLFLESFTQSLVEAIKIGFDEAKILEMKSYVNHHRNQINFQITIQPLSSTTYLVIEILRSKAVEKDANVFLLYPKTRVRSIYEPLINAIYHKVNNKFRAGVFSNPLERLKSYQTIIANSLFTQKWIMNYWKRESVVVYPPVELLCDKYKMDNLNKKKWICSVGRFFTLGHGKKQEILIKAFKEFYNSGHKDWQLHLVGGVGSEVGNIELIAHLKKESEGYPVFFHLNVSRKEVEEIYIQSKIYWHATGYRENESFHPIKFEHFGIAPIEAISAGCVPVLYNGGGLREIISVTGLQERLHLFSSINQLVNNTTEILKQDISSTEWELILETLRNNFSYNAFRNKFMALIK
ncbi:MAG: glycosyltransferase [Candidatus Daviesbacteria bacterium]|nr:glycosyltransferase [Candidatus Daviesbacteria bacterium]